MQLLHSTKLKNFSILYKSIKNAFQFSELNFLQALKFGGVHFISQVYWVNFFFSHTEHA